MAIISVPERGQPLDVNYLYELAQAINTLSSQISPANYKYVSVDTPASGTQNVKASEARILGGYVSVYNNATVSAGDSKDFSYTFPADFKFAPIVTVTPINVGNTLAGKNMSVILKTVTTSKVEGVVRFNQSGDLTVAVNLIVVGIPN
jgi:hypothetical protein